MQEKISLRDRVGLLIESHNVRDAINRAEEAEQAGIPQIWMKVDGGGKGFPDVLTLLAAVALHTSSIKLGTAIVPVYPLHPITMARQALVVDELAPGRLRLGIGSSNRMVMGEWYGLELSSPLPYLREYLTILRSAFTQERIDFQGKFFHTAFPSTRPAPIEILTSALGKKAFRQAGEIADGALSWMCPVPYLLSSALPALEAGAQVSQRPRPPLIAHILVALSTNTTKITSIVQDLVGNYAQLPFYARMFAEAGFSGVSTGNADDLLAATNTLVISGDDATVLRQLKALLTSGLGELMLQIIPIADETQERHQLLNLLAQLDA